jgi:phage-related protein
MAVVGEAIIIVRTVSTGFDKQLRDSVKGVDKIGGDAGGRFSRSFKKSAGRGSIGDIFKKDKKSFLAIGREAARVGQAFNSLQRVGYSVGTAIGVLGSSLSSLVVGVVSLGGAVLSATPALVALGGGLAAVIAGGIAAKMALSGVGAAVSALNKKKMPGAGGGGGKDLSKELAKIAQRNAENLAAADKKLLKSKLELTKAQIAFNKALKEGAEEIQQLGFDAEDAAIAEKKAALELEAARETLARVQDLPPNSRARREAELAYEEADLNLRMAMDKNKDLQAEQDRLAKEGVAGTNAVISATDNLTSAEESYMDAVDGKAKAERDAIQAVLDAKERAAKSSAGGSDPLAGLTASQKTFAKYLSSLKPKLDELKEAAAAGFLPILQTSIEQIVDKAFPTFKTGLNLVGKAMGNATKSVSDAIVNGENLKKLNSLFESSGGVLESLGKSVGSLWGSLLSILQAAEPLTKRFFGWIEKTTAGWDKMLNTKNADGSLKAFFDTAGDIAAQLGKIFGNTFGFIGNLVKANTGPGSGGQILLDYLKDITAGWKANTDYTGDGPGSLREFFRDAAINLKSILGFLGPLTKEFIKLAGDPNTKKFWDTLAGAVPSIGKIFTNLNEGGPAMAELMVTLTKMVEVLSESGGVKAFFKTLNFAAKILLKILDSGPVKKFMSIIAPMHGFFLAMGTIFLVVKTAAFFLLYVIQKLVTYIGYLIKIFKFLIKVVRIVAMVFRLMFAGNPIGLIILAIIALIAIFVVLFKKNKAFRDFVLAMWAKIKAVLAVVWDGLKAGLEAAWKVIQVVWDLIIAGVKIYIKIVTTVISFVWNILKTGLEFVWNGIKFVWDLIVAGVKIYISVVTAVIGFVWNVLKTGLEFVWNAIKFVWDLIVAGVKLYISVVTTVISFVWNALKTGLEFVWNAIKWVWDLIVKGVKAYIALVVKVLSTIWNGLKTGIDWVWDKVKMVWDKIMSFISGIKEKIAKIGSTMWDGLKTGLQAVINFIISGVNGIIKILNKAIDGANKLNPFDDIPNIPEIKPIKLATGGVVSPSSGGTLAMIAEAGRPERVEPLDAQGLSVRDRAIIKFLAGKQGAGAGANLTFKVYPSEKMSEADLAAAISRQVGFMIRKGGV